MQVEIKKKLVQPDTSRRSNIKSQSYAVGKKKDPFSGVVLELQAWLQVSQPVVLEEVAKKLAVPWCGSKTKRSVKSCAEPYEVKSHWYSLAPGTGTGTGTAGAAGTGTGNAGAAGAGTAPLGLVKYNGALALDLFFLRLVLGSSANFQQKFERQTHCLVGNHDG